MTNLDRDLIPRAPFADLRVPPTAGAGVIVSYRNGLGLAAILVRRDKSEALVQRVREHFFIELPQGPHLAAAGQLAFAGTGPGAWFAISECGGNIFAESLRKAVGELSSISDQSDGYAVLRLSGRNVLDTLCKLVPVDVHPSVFKVGNVAATFAAKIGTTLWRLGDGDDGSPVFEIAVPRSLAASFLRAMWQGRG